MKQNLAIQQTLQQKYLLTQKNQNALEVLKMNHEEITKLVLQFAQRNPMFACRFHQEKDYEMMDTVHAPISLKEELYYQLHTCKTSIREDIAAYFIESLDENGYILKEEKETQTQFVQRLSKISSQFNKVITAIEWASKQMNNSIYFINITDHTNDELQKVITNYYYKEKIEYVFYDTLKTDTANIGNPEEIKKTATILSNLAQNFDMFICSSLQLSENTTMPINLNVNDLAVSKTVKEVLDTLCLFKQISRDDYDKYEYSKQEVDTKFFNLEKSKNPDVRYYACVIDKNRAGAKPKLVFKLNLVYNSWEELGYLKLK